MFCAGRGRDRDRDHSKWNRGFTDRHTVPTLYLYPDW
jgi:hypothetical protein